MVQRQPAGFEVPSGGQRNLGVKLANGLPGRARRLLRGHARNLAVAASGDAVIAIGGSYGTIAEMALALRLGRRVVALEGAPRVDGTLDAGSPAEAVELALRDLGETSS